MRCPPVTTAPYSFVIKQALGLIRGNTVTVLHARDLQFKHSS